MTRKDPDTGNVPAVCVVLAKRYDAPPAQQARGLEGLTSCVRSTCRPQSYPVGYTLLECRLNGDQPVAQVVQLPCKPTTAEPKICFLVETRQSASGPFSRVTSRPYWGDHMEDSCHDICQRHDQAPPLSFTLESHESPHDAVASASKVPIKNDTPRWIVTKLETREAECRDGPTSKILCESTIEEPSRDMCSRECYTSPLTQIECTVTENGPLARVIQCPDSKYTTSSSTNLPKAHFETCVCHDDCSPTARYEIYPTTCSERTDQRQAYATVETRVDDCGAHVNATNFLQKCPGSNYYTNLESKHRSDGRIATISQRLLEQNDSNADEQIDDGDRNNVAVSSALSPDYSASTDCSDSLRSKRLKSGHRIRDPSHLQAELCLIKLNKRNGLEPTVSEMKKAGCFKKTPATKRTSRFSCCDQTKKSLPNYENRRQSCLRDKSVDRVVCKKSPQVQGLISHKKSQGRKDCLQEVYQSRQLPSPMRLYSENVTNSSNQNNLRAQSHDCPQRVSAKCVSQLCKPIQESSLGYEKKERYSTLGLETGGRRIHCEQRSSSEEKPIPTQVQLTNHLKCEREGKAKFSKGSISLPASQELLTCYREYIPEGQLQRYEACRSKRNGLQDECILPVPRAVIEILRDKHRYANQTKEHGLAVDKLDPPSSNIPILTGEGSNAAREQDCRETEFISEH